MKRTLAGLSLLVVAACGGQAPAPASPPKAGSVDIVGVTPAQHKLAHLRTADGMTSLVLDRSGASLRYQLDGKADVIELTQKEDRDHASGQLRGYVLADPAGKHMFLIDVDGNVTYLPDGDRFPLMFDKDAAPLGPATVTGTYVPPPPAYKATVDRLAAIAVRTMLPDVKAEDSAILAKVTDVLGRATPDMFVHYASHGQTDWSPRLAFVPEPFHGVAFGGVAYTTDDPWNPKAKGLAKYGGKNQGFSFPDTPKGNHMQVMTLQGYAPKLAEGTPGLIWEVDGTSATFVAFDGGRYAVDLSKAGDGGQTLEGGVGASDSWPTPARDTLLTVPDVSSLAKAGAVPQKTSDDLLAFDTRWTDCAAKVWASVQRRIDSGTFTDADRKDVVAKTRVSCASIVQAQEAALLKVVEARMKERLALFAAAKAKVGK